MKLYFDDESFDGQLQRSIGKADSGMANVGECLAIAEQITVGDRDSWQRAWSQFAITLVDQAEVAMTAGHRVSARGALLSAAEYFRQAFCFHRDNLDADELRTGYAASVRAFQAALPLLDYPAEILSDGLSGYLFTPRDADRRLPTILHIGGYDGTAESSLPLSFRHLTAGTHLRRSMVPVRVRCCTTSECRCARTGSMWSRVWSMP